MVIDAHQHFWVYDADRDSWITENMATIRRDFFPSNLGPILKDNGVDGCVAVQVSQSDSETDFLLQLAESNSFIEGVVGWVDLRSPALRDKLEFYAQYEKLKGFRHIVQAESNDFLTRPDFIKGVKELSAFDYTYDILVYPTQLPAALEFVKSIPEVKFIVDHLAKPYIKAGAIDQWKKDISALAVHENVYCKVSGMVTEADWQGWKTEDFTPYLDTIFEVFGTNRLVYGSDWPVCLLAADYSGQKSIVDNYLTSFSKDEKHQVMGLNAIQFYQLT